MPWDPPTSALPTTFHLGDVEHQVGVAAPLEGVQALAIVPEEVPPCGGTLGQSHDEAQGIPSGLLAGGPRFLGFKDRGAVGLRAARVGVQKLEEVVGTCTLWTDPREVTGGRSPGWAGWHPPGHAG